MSFGRPRSRMPGARPLAAASEGPPQLALVDPVGKTCNALRSGRSRAVVSKEGLLYLKQRTAYEINRLHTERAS